MAAGSSDSGKTDKRWQTALQWSLHELLTRVLEVRPHLARSPTNLAEACIISGLREILGDDFEIERMLRELGSGTSSEGELDEIAQSLSNH